MARAKRKGADFLAQDIVRVDDDLFDTLPIEYVQLGCDPSLNIYGEIGNIPGDPRTLPYRFAGGHIHFGHNWLLAAADRAGCAAAVVADLDKVLGTWSVGVAGPYESLKKRRTYYGLAGEFRIPPHGVEYRSLSNFWLASPGMFSLTFAVAARVFLAHMVGVTKFWLNDFMVTQNTINTYDVETARKTIRANEKQFLAICGENIGKVALKACYEGMESIVAKPLAIAENWGLQ